MDEEIFISPSRFALGFQYRILKVTLPILFYYKPNQKYPKVYGK